MAYPFHRDDVQHSGIVLNVVGLLCWTRCARCGRGWLLVTGICLALSAWHHPLCAMVLAGAIVVHSLIWAACPSPTQAERATEPFDRWMLIRRMFVVGVVSFALASPLVVHLARLEKRNTHPLRYFAPELHELSYAAHWHAPLVPVLGLIGAVIVVRTTPRCAWIVGYLVVGLPGLLGQVVGYVGHDLSWPIPYLVPHEFQWHEQFALAVCVAVATTTIARRGIRPAQRHPPRPVRTFTV